MDNIKFINHVRFYRNKRNLTQLDLARICGVSKNTICSIENHLSIPSTKLALCISFALVIPLEDLFAIKPADYTFLDEG